MVSDLFGGVPIGSDRVSRVPTEADRKIILQIVEDGLKRGALGAGPPTGYMTAGFTSQELIEIQKLAGK